MDAFVYGTLRDPERARELLGHADFGPDALLRGLHRVDARYPTLAPGGETRGRVLRLRDDDLEALDAYEGVDRGLYVRVRVPGDQGALWTYAGDPDADVEPPVDALVSVEGLKVIVAESQHPAPCLSTRRQRRMSGVDPMEPAEQSVGAEIGVSEEFTGALGVLERPVDEGVHGGPLAPPVQEGSNRREPKHC